MQTVPVLPLLVPCDFALFRLFFSLGTRVCSLIVMDQSWSTSVVFLDEYSQVELLLVILLLCDVCLGWDLARDRVGPARCCLDWTSKVGTIQNWSKIGCSQLTQTAWRMSVSSSRANPSISSASGPNSCYLTLISTWSLQQWLHL